MADNGGPRVLPDVELVSQSVSLLLVRQFECGINRAQHYRFVVVEYLGMFGF